MTVSELIEKLQKLPQDDEIFADVLGDFLYAEIMTARHYSPNRSFITIDRTEQMKNRLLRIADERLADADEELEGLNTR